MSYKRGRGSAGRQYLLVHCRRPLHLALNQLCWRTILVPRPPPICFCVRHPKIYTRARLSRLFLWTGEVSRSGEGPPPLPPTGSVMRGASDPVSE